MERTRRVSTRAMEEIDADADALAGLEEADDEDNSHFRRSTRAQNSNGSLEPAADTEEEQEGFAPAAREIPLEAEAPLADPRLASRGADENATAPAAAPEAAAESAGGVRTLCIRGLPSDVTRRELRNLVALLDGFEACSQTANTGFVRFSTAALCRAARGKLDGHLVRAHTALCSSSRARALFSFLSDFLLSRPVVRSRSLTTHPTTTGASVHRLPTAS